MTICREQCKTAEPIQMPFGLFIVALVGCKESCMMMVQFLQGKCQFRGKWAPIVKYKDCLPWAVQKQLNQSICLWGCGVSWAQELCTRWGPDPYTWRGNLMAKRGRAGHARTCPAVTILGVTQRGVGPVWCRCQLGCTRWGAHWHHLANTIDPPVCGGDAASCQITLTTCFSVHLTR